MKNKSGTLALPLHASAHEDHLASPAPEAPVQVHLVTPALVCWGLQRLVQTARANLLLVGCSNSLEEALPQLERNPPDVVVLDLDDGYGPVDVAHLYDAMRLKVLSLSSRAEEGFLQAVLEAGARGFLRKRAAPEMFLKGIEVVAAGEVFVSHACTERLFVAAAEHAARSPKPEDTRIGNLTARELETIAAVTADAAQPVKAVAGKLRMSERTLRNHLTTVYSKLGVSGRLGLYVYASQHALNGGADRGAAHRRGA